MGIFDFCLEENENFSNLGPAVYFRGCIMPLTKGNRFIQKIQKNKTKMSKINIRELYLSHPEYFTSSEAFQDAYTLHFVPNNDKRSGYVYMILIDYQVFERLKYHEINSKEDLNVIALVINHDLHIEKNELIDHTVSLAECFSMDYMLALKEEGNKLKEEYKNREVDASYLDSKERMKEYRHRDTPYPSETKDFTFASSSKGYLIRKYLSSDYEVSLPEYYLVASVVGVVEEAFKDNPSLERVYIPKGYLSLESRCFANCEKLSYVQLPNSIEHLEDELFLDDKALESITYKGTKKEWERIKKDPFWNKGSSLKKVICLDEEIIL